MKILAHNRRNFDATASFICILKDVCKNVKKNYKNESRRQQVQTERFSLLTRAQTNLVFFKMKTFSSTHA